MKKGYKVLGIRCHIGVQVRGSVETGISVSRSNVELFLEDDGVFIDCATPSLVPFSNISQVMLEKCDDKKPEAPKPTPGEGPKPLAK